MAVLIRQQSLTTASGLNTTDFKTNLSTNNNKILKFTPVHCMYTAASKTTSNNIHRVILWAYRENRDLLITPRTSEDYQQKSCTGIYRVFLWAYMQMKLETLFKIFNVNFDLNKHY